MLLEWKRTKARDATYGALVKVLRDLEYNATAKSWRGPPVLHSIPIAAVH